VVESPQNDAQNAGAASSGQDMAEMRRLRVEALERARQQKSGERSLMQVGKTGEAGKKGGEKDR
jgi:hypothetical protein